MKILLLQSKDLLKPDLGMWVWSGFCILVVLLGLAALVKFLIKYNFPFTKNKNNVKAFASALLLMGLFSCSDKELKPDSTSKLDKLATDFNLKVVLGTKAADENALHFANVSDARAFLDQVKQNSNWVAPNGAINDLQTAYAAGLSSSQRSQLNRFLNDAIKAREGYDGNEGNETPPGNGYFSQRLLPWNKIYVQMNWDNNGNITNVQSGLSGFTLGLGWTQISYTPVLQENGSYIIQITYTVTYSLFVEGIGNLYVGDPQVIYAAVLNVNDGGGTGGNFSFVNGTLHSSLAGAIDRLQRK